MLSSSHIQGDHRALFFDLTSGMLHVICRCGALSSHSIYQYIPLESLNRAVGSNIALSSVALFFFSDDIVFIYLVIHNWWNFLPDIFLQGGWIVPHPPVQQSNINTEWIIHHKISHRFHRCHVRSDIGANVKIQSVETYIFCNYQEYRCMDVWTLQCCWCGSLLSYNSIIVYWAHF